MSTVTTRGHETEEKIRQFITTETSRRRSEPLGDDAPLLDEIDSLDVQALVLFLESEFEIGVDETDVTVENFSSLARVADLVRKKRAATSANR
jgi:acyl carrier protein